MFYESCELSFTDAIENSKTAMSKKMAVKAAPR